MKKRKKYRIIATKFMGYNPYNNNEGSYTYEITFNKSLDHTGKYKGIEDGLNRYDKIEPWKECLISFKRCIRMIVLGIKRLF